MDFIHRHFALIITFERGKVSYAVAKRDLVIVCDSLFIVGNLTKHPLTSFSRPDLHLDKEQLKKLIKEFLLPCYKPSPPS